MPGITACIRKSIVERVNKSRHIFFVHLEPLQSIQCVSNYFAVLSVDASPRSRLSHIALLVVARLTFISEVVRVQADILIIAVGIIQPYFVVDYFTRLLPTLLTCASVHSHTVCYISCPCPAPCLALIELLLSHLHTPVVYHAYILHLFQSKVGVPPMQQKKMQKALSIRPAQKSPGRDRLPGSAQINIQIRFD